MAIIFIKKLIPAERDWYKYLLNYNLDRSYIKDRNMFV